MNCRNCGSHVTGNYCTHCEQPTSTTRFDGRYLLRSMLDTFDLDRGLLHVIVVLLWKPGRAVREYIDGHRVNFYNPFKLFLITGALSTFLIFHFHLYGETAGESGALQWLGLREAEDFSYYSSKYLTYFSIAAVPVFSFISWLFFRYTGVNLTENLIMNVYAASGQFLLICLYAPVVIYVPGAFTGFIYAVINTIYNVWVLAVFFRATNLRGLFRSLGAVVVSYVVMLFINYCLFIITPSHWWTIMDEWVG